MKGLTKDGALVGEIMPDEPNRVRVTVNSNNTFDAEAIRELHETIRASCAIDITLGAASPSVRITIE